jgi:hypothetical protein
METHYIILNKIPLKKPRKHCNTSDIILFYFFFTKYDAKIKNISLEKVMTLCYNQVKILPF